MNNNDNGKSTSRISITAHYTGFNWYAHGLSHPAFATFPGRILFYSIKPWMWMVKKVFKINELEISLLQRHLIIDLLLEKSIRERGVRQVIEIACGLSPRGYRFMNDKNIGDILYIEADLPGMAKLKKEKFAKAGYSNDRHMVIPCDIFSRGGDCSLENIVKKYLRPGAPAAIITEGLINYFDIESIETIWRRIAGVLSSLGGGVYLSDNMCHKADHPLYLLVGLWVWAVGLFARGKFHMHFFSDTETGETLRRAGFRELIVHDPESYNDVLNLPASSMPSFMTVIEGIV